MPATAVDLRDLVALARNIGEANAALGRVADTPAAVAGFVEDLTDAISDEEDREIARINPWLWIALQRAALRAQAALRAEDPDRRRRLRIALEQMRFLLSRIDERAPIGEDRPATDVARWLEATLPSVSQSRKASLLGVSPRTYQRWVSTAAPTTPGGEDERRLRIVARLVNQLRHSLTEAGVVDWFAHPREELGGARPQDALDDPSRLEALVTSAAASRAQVAA